MGEWKKYKLGDAPIEIIDGDRGKNYPKKDEFYENGYCLFLNTKNVTTSGLSFTELNFVTKEKDKLLRKGKLKKYDLVLTTRGTVGNVGFYNDNVIYDKLRINSGMVIIRPNAIDKEFNYQLFKYLKKDFESFTTGSAQPQLPIRDLKEMSFLLPPLPEQKAIASVLSSLDDKIDLLHRQNKTLEAMAETLFRQWFVPARAGEPHAGGEEADEDWDDGCLGDVIELFDHLRIPLSKMERDKKKNGQLYPYYGAAKVMDYINDYIFDGDYILLGEDGTVRTDKGYPVLQYATGKFWVNNHTHVIKAKPPYNNFFLWNYLSKKNIDEIVTGAVQPKINQGNLKALDFPKFPEDLVIEFNEQTESFFKKINHNQTQIHTLEKLRDTLLPKLMSGEVRMET